VLELHVEVGEVPLNDNDLLLQLPPLLEVAEVVLVEQAGHLLGGGGVVEQPLPSCPPSSRTGGGEVGMWGGVLGAWQGCTAYTVSIRTRSEAPMLAQNAKHGAVSAVLCLCPPHARDLLHLRIFTGLSAPVPLLGTLLHAALPAPLHLQQPTNWQLQEWAGGA
jgi:hypothetical protein